MFSSLKNSIPSFASEITERTDRHKYVQVYLDSTFVKTKAELFVTVHKENGSRTKSSEMSPTQQQKH